jgi:hypothetical protein
LEQARALAEAIGVADEQWQLDVILETAYRAVGDIERALQAQLRSASIIRELAGQIDDRGARAVFLAQARDRVAQMVEFQRTPAA